MPDLAEPALEPELPICDAHHHLWDRPRGRYLLDDLRRDVAGGHRVERTVFVECMSMYREDGPEDLRPVGETAFVERLADESAAGSAEPVIEGIVGFADLTLGDSVASVLEAHIEASPRRFRGIRHATAWDASPEIRASHTNPPPGLLGDPAFRAGFACLGRYGLVFDAWLYHAQLGELADIARALPDVVVVLDHVGGPLGIGPHADRRREVFAEWKRGIREVAACPNVSVKLGGLAMPRIGFGWHRRETPPSSAELAEATSPYLLHCIEAFGPDRCMFESNFPVDAVSCDYTVLWNSFKRVTGGFSADERRDLFHDTAVRIYRLGQ